MQQAEIHDYLIRFFTAAGCTLLPETNSSLISVKLTEEMDKLLMNRPFYWHYIKQIGGTAETAVLRLRVDDSTEEGELIYFGAPRLHQIFDTARKLAPFIRMYQMPRLRTSSALEPWLCLNMKISYQCDLKMDRIRSMGLQLINGTLIDGFHELLHNLPLRTRLPDYSYTLSPLITIKSGISRIENFISRSLNEEPAEWADDAGKRWMRELDLLDSFYETEQEKPETYFQEKKALQEQYQPRIQIHLINAGLFYLQSSSFMP